MGVLDSIKFRKKFYQHKHDFALSVRWVVFATSHCKQACDGISGTVKQLVSNASLKRGLKDQV